MRLRVVARGRRGRTFGAVYYVEEFDGRETGEAVELLSGVRRSEISARLSRDDTVGDEIWGPTFSCLTRLATFLCLKNLGRTVFAKISLAGWMRTDR